MMKVTGNYTEKEIWDAIHTLSDIRAGYNLFGSNDVEKYDACSMGILALREIAGADKI